MHRLPLHYHKQLFRFTWLGLLLLFTAVPHARAQISNPLSSDVANLMENVPSNMNGSTEWLQLANNETELSEVSSIALDRSVYDSGSEAIELAQQLPELAASLQLESAVAAPGERLTLSITVQNVGSIAVAESAFQLFLGEELSLSGPLVGAVEQETSADVTRFTIGNLDTGETQHLSAYVVVGNTLEDELLIRLESEEPIGATTVVAYATLWIHKLELQPVGITGEEEITAEGDNEPGGWIFRPIEPVPALFSGAATYNYPLETPPARGNMGPNLSLNYSSRTVDGKRGWFDSNRYGEGWSLSGISFITRQDLQRCIGQSSDQYFICFGGGFKLYLNGNDYKLIGNGGCGTNCSLYLAENAPSLRVERYTSGGSNELGEYWLVRTPDGGRYRFGYYEDSEQVFYRACVSGLGSCENVATYRWYLDELQDPHDNQMIIQYDDSEASGAWGCGSTICREVDVWPVLIRYNSIQANPDREVRNHWKAEVVFGWSSMGVSVSGG